MAYKARIKWRGGVHPAQEWGKKRNVKKGYRFPATAQIRVKPNGAKVTVRYDNVKLNELRLLNGEAGFNVARRIGGFLFNTTRNKHLISRLKGLLWWTKNFVPYPLPKGKVAIAEGIYCDSNVVTVESEQGRWCKLAPGVGYLVEVEIGSDARHPTGVRWRNPGGYIEKVRLERI